MIMQFLGGMLIGGGGVFALVAGAVIVGLMGWMDRGSH